MEECMFCASVQRGGERSECANYMGISLVDKVYGGILIDRISSSVDRAIVDEQYCFREGRGCVDQIFVREIFGSKQ